MSTSSSAAASSSSTTIHHPLLTVPPHTLLTHPTLFVIQEHDATAHHYDLRLRVPARQDSGLKVEDGVVRDDVLRSWAVPKGPSGVPGERRVAVETEDHELEYALYEGVIPSGSYGAGTVVVWDIGTYEVAPKDSKKWLAKQQATGKLKRKRKVDDKYYETTSSSGSDTEIDEVEDQIDERKADQQRLVEGLARDHITLRFNGVKLKGEYTLIKLASSKNTQSLKDPARQDRRSRSMSASSSRGGSPSPTPAPSLEGIHKPVAGRQSWLLVKKKDEGGGSGSSISSAAAVPLPPLPPGRSVPLSLVHQFPASVLSGKTAAEIAAEHGTSMRVRGLKRERSGVKKEAGVKSEVMSERVKREGGGWSGVVDLDTVIFLFTVHSGGASVC
ncbi:hypothetical protein HDV00_011012 [Rhizophlyctis rosea]|nr:hypothetical protein HDV00_011012 [Rhizophlyctis rosea]